MAGFIYMIVMFSLYRKKMVEVNVSQLGYADAQKTFDEVFKKFDYGNIFLLYLIKKQLNNTQYFELLRYNFKFVYKFQCFRILCNIRF